MIITNPLIPLGIFPVPFLTEDMGPSKVTFKYKKMFQSNRNIGGYSFSHWGDQPDTMSVSGIVGLKPGQEQLCLLALQVLKTLYRLDKKKLTALSSLVQKTVAATSIASVTAAAYQELSGEAKLAIKNGTALNIASSTLGALAAGVSLTQMYQQMQKDPAGLSTTYIYQDNYIYKGFFTDFQYTRDAYRPRIVEYSFDFTIDWNTENWLADKLIQNNTLKSVVPL